MSDSAPPAWGANAADDLAADLVVEELGRGHRPGEVHVQVRPSHIPSGSQAVYGPEGPHVGAPWPLDMAGIELDWFQAAASRCNERRESVLVAAPTSAGKTVVAFHAVQRCLTMNATCAYTAPVKALSNQKFLEFSEKFGTDQVCLLTGDVTAGNPDDASIVVMTTEVLVSMLHRGASDQNALLKKLHTVVFDEVHYIADEERGTAWEEAILLLERNVCLVCLSATVANYVELAGWLAQTQHAPCHAVFTKHRPVPLEHRIFPCPPACASVMVADSEGQFKRKGLDALQQLPVTGGEPDEDRRGQELKAVLEECRKQKDLPVLIFSFSRAECARFARELAVNVKLPADKARQVKSRVQELLSKPLKKEDQELQSIRECAEFLLPRGVGMHHGGLLPILREVTEMLFKEGLIKVLFTTETFALGVNMPSRAVIFNFASGREFRKFDGHEVRRLKAGEYIQISGRAGRRNIDLHGRAISMVSHSVPVGFLRKLVTGRAEKVESRLKLSYGLILRCLRWSRGTLELILMQSLKQFQSKQVEPVLRTEEEKKIALLQSIGLLDPGFKLTLAGEAAAHVHVATDDLVAIGLLLDGVVDKPETDMDTFIAFLSCLVNDTEETEEVQTPAVFAPLWLQCEQQVQHIGALQREHGLDPPSDDDRLRKIRCCGGMAEAVLLWQKGGTFAQASIAAGGSEQDGLLARVLRRTHALAREFELALRILDKEDQASKVREAHRRLHRGGRDFQVLPFLESIYLPIAVDPNTIERETLRNTKLPCPHPPGSEIMLNPAEIGFSHISVSRRFRDGHTIRDSVNQLLKGGRKRDIAHEMVEVYWIDGQFFTLANRRLAVFRLFAQHCPERGSLIKVKVVDDARARQWHFDRKFTTGLWRGWRCRVRGTGELIGRSLAETRFDMDLTVLSMNADQNSPETGFARAAKDTNYDEDSLSDGEDQDRLDENISEEDGDAEVGEESDADDSLIIEDNSIVINPRRVIEFVLERELGDDSPRCLSVPASKFDLLDVCESGDDVSSPAIPDRCANIHEYLRNFALPLLDELREDLRSKLEPRELKSEDLQQAKTVQLVPYKEALRRSQKGDVPKLPKWFPAVGGEHAHADAVVLKDCKPAADLAPYQVVLLFEQGSVFRPSAIADDGAAVAPGAEAEPGALRIAHPDCYHFGLVYTTPKSKQAVVCVGRRSGAPISGRHRIVLTYSTAAAAAADIQILTRGSVSTANRVRVEGQAAKSGVRHGFVVLEMDGWDGLPVTPALPYNSGPSVIQDSGSEADPVRIVFEGEERKWCFVALGCNANTHVRVAEALATPDLHQPIFWQNAISGNPLNDSTAWSGVSRDQCTSLGNDSEYAQDLREAGLNDSQCGAIEQVISCKEGVRLIQGPPGTGKTHMLINTLDLCAKLGLEEQANRCLVCAPTNIAVREIAQRLVERLSARSSFTKALLSQVALIAMEDRANVSNDDNDMLSQILLDHRKKRIKRIARFWLAEQFYDCGKTCLKQFSWSWEGVDPLTALLVDTHRAHNAAQRQEHGTRNSTKLSDFVRSALAAMIDKINLQLQQLEADFPFGTTVFELPPRKRAEAKAQRLERRIYEDLCRLKKALGGFASCLEKFLLHLSPEVAARLDSCTVARSKGQRGAQTAPSTASASAPSPAFNKHTREAACRWAPLAARSDPEAVEGLTMLLGLSRSEDADAADEGNGQNTGPSSVPASPSEEELKRALNKFRLLIHPDKAPAEMRTLATESFKYLDDAFDAVRRRACGKSPGATATDRPNARSQEKQVRDRGPVDEALREERAKTALQALEAALKELKDASLYVRSADSGALRNTCLRRCVLVMSTVTVAGRPSVAGQRIPTLFVDEACQSCEAETLIALRSDVQRLFLIGDPRQLPATVSSPLAKHAKYERSMFERLEAIGIAPLMLNQQYRMKPSILVWSNTAFYNNEISTADSVLQQSRNWIVKMGLDRLTGKSARSRHELGSFRLFNTARKEWTEETVGHSLRNPKEAQQLLSLLFQYYKCCSPDSTVTIGIITPYRAQLELFQEELENKTGPVVDWLRSCTTVATVDGFQGNERDIIAISAVRSGRGLIGFSGDEKRLNVAVTRARQHVWIVGDLETLEHGPSMYGTREERPNVWQHLIPFARERGWVIDLAPEQLSKAEPTEDWARDLCKEGPWMDMRMDQHLGKPCPWCMLCSCWADYAHIESRGHLDARQTRGVDFARRRLGRVITLDLHLDAGESEFGVDVVKMTGQSLLGNWMRVNSISDTSTLQCYNSNTEEQLKVPVGSWILEANGLVGEAGIRETLNGTHDIELTISPSPPPFLPPLPAPGESSYCSAEEGLKPCHVNLDQISPWYRDMAKDGPWIKFFWKDQTVFPRCLLCDAWADEGHLDSRRHKQEKREKGPGFLQTDRQLPPPPPPPLPAGTSTKAPPAAPPRQPAQQLAPTRAPPPPPPPPPPPNGTSMERQATTPPPQPAQQSAPVRAPHPPPPAQQPAPTPAPAPPPTTMSIPRTVMVSSGPLDSEHVFWLELNDDCILCIADDGNPQVQFLWQCAHGEMESALGDVARVQHNDLQLPDHQAIQAALQKTDIGCWYFCVASSNGLRACGIADRKPIRERVAKAAIAVAAQLKSAFVPPRLQTLLPLARQCEAALPHQQSGSMRPCMNTNQTRANRWRTSAAAAPVAAAAAVAAAPQTQLPPPPAVMPQSARPCTPPAPVCRPQFRPPAESEQACTSSEQACTSTALAVRNGPLKSDSIMWLQWSYGPILCIADDRTSSAQILWQNAHAEMQYILEGGMPEFEHVTDSQTPSGYHEIGSALSETVQAGRQFCVAVFDGLYACGVGDTVKIRDRVAKAAIAVVVQLRYGFAQSYLDMLLPLARQCHAAPRPRLKAWDEPVQSDVGLVPPPPPPPPPPAPPEDFEEMVDV